MSHGIVSVRDFVLANTDERDWHKLTRKQDGLDPAIHFPLLKSLPTYYGEDMHATGESVLVSTDDNKVCGKSFNPQTFGVIVPQRAWEMIHSALSGTEFTVERIGMLWCRSFWFVSVALDELKAVSLKGHKFNLNFSGALNGEESPQGELADLRTVCWNTVNISRMTGDRLFKIKQTKNSLVRLDNAESDVEKAVGMAKIFNETLLSLEAKPVTVETARNVYLGEAIANGAKVERVNKRGETVGNKTTLNRVDSLVSLFQRGDGNKGQTRADVLNGFTQYFTRGGADDSAKSAWQAIGSSEFGGNADRKAKFFASVADDKAFDTLAEIGASAN
jgi:hypothetical protein